MRQIENFKKDVRKLIDKYITQEQCATVDIEKALRELSGEGDPLCTCGTEMFCPDCHGDYE